VLHAPHLQIPLQFQSKLAHPVFADLQTVLTGLSAELHLGSPSFPTPQTILTRIMQLGTQGSSTSFSCMLALPLTAQLLEHIEQVRNGNDLQLTLSLVACLTVRSIPQNSVTDVDTASGFSSFPIPRSHWVDHCLSPMGYSAGHRVESAPKEVAMNNPDRALVRKHKTYGVQFPAQVLRQAQALFVSYLDENQKSAAIHLWGVSTTDGEDLRITNPEEFYLFYDDANRTASSHCWIQFPSPGEPYLDILSVPKYTDVRVELPSRDQVDNILQLFTREESRLLASVRADLRQQNQDQAVPMQPNRKLTVFIGHGHDSQWKRLRDFLQRVERLNVIYYESRSRAGFTTGEVLEEMTGAADMAFIVHTGEDEDKEGALHARENVVHEAGLFQTKLGFKRAIVLLEEGCNEYNNISGIDQIRFAKGQVETSFGDVLQAVLREFPGRL
jgi:predicted nucleotide-binding protein